MMFVCFFTFLYVFNYFSISSYILLTNPNSLNFGLLEVIPSEALFLFHPRCLIGHSVYYYFSKFLKAFFPLQYPICH